MKSLLLCLIVAGGCVISGTNAVQAQSLSVAGILFDFSSCGPGSMCTNSGYICR
jgi:hypothetical protein